LCGEKIDDDVDVTHVSGLPTALFATLHQRNVIEIVYKNLACQVRLASSLSS
jgi:hypothetical protein